MVDGKNTVRDTLTASRSFGQFYGMFLPPTYQPQRAASISQNDAELRLLDEWLEATKHRFSAPANWEQTLESAENASDPVNHLRRRSAQRCHDCEQLKKQLRGLMYDRARYVARLKRHCDSLMTATQYNNIAQTEEQTPGLDCATARDLDVQLPYYKALDHRIQHLVSVPLTSKSAYESSRSSMLPAAPLHPSYITSPQLRLFINAASYAPREACSQKTGTPPCPPASKSPTTLPAPISAHSAKRSGKFTGDRIPRTDSTADHDYRSRPAIKADGSTEKSFVVIPTAQEPSLERHATPPLLSQTTVKPIVSRDSSSPALNDVAEEKHTTIPTTISGSLPDRGALKASALPTRPHFKPPSDTAQSLSIPTPLPRTAKLPPPSLKHDLGLPKLLLPTAKSVKPLTVLQKKQSNVDDVSQTTAFPYDATTIPDDLRKLADSELPTAVSGAQQRPEIPAPLRVPPLQPVKISNVTKPKLKTLEPSTAQPPSVSPSVAKAPPVSKLVVIEKPLSKVAAVAPRGPLVTRKPASTGHRLAPLSEIKSKKPPKTSRLKPPWPSTSKQKDATANATPSIKTPIHLKESSRTGSDLSSRVRKEPTSTPSLQQPALVSLRPPPKPVAKLPAPRVKGLPVLDVPAGVAPAVVVSQVSKPLAAGASPKFLLPPTELTISSPKLVPKPPKSRSVTGKALPPKTVTVSNVAKPRLSVAKMGHSSTKPASSVAPKRVFSPSEQGAVLKLAPAQPEQRSVRFKIPSTSPVSTKHSTSPLRSEVAKTAKKQAPKSKQYLRSTKAGLPQNSVTKEEIESMQLPIIGLTTASGMFKEIKLKKAAKRGK